MMNTSIKTYKSFLFCVSIANLHNSKLYYLNSIQPTVLKSLSMFNVSSLVE